MKKLIIIITLLPLVISGCKVVQRAESVSTAQTPVLVIDPGHGGADGGAVAPDGTEESELNLAVSIKIAALSGFLGINSVMTRSAEDLDYPESANTIRAKKLADQKARIKLINSVQNAVLISVHQNTYPNSKPRGAQALYGNIEGSRELAELIQSNFSLYADADNKRSAAKISDDIYLMKKVQCPAVLVECGFMSTPAELEHLKTEEYQMKLAAVLLASYTQFISETGNFYG